jgi:hypothetical protein
VLKVVACPPPGIGAKKVQGSPRNSFRSTYIGGSVAVKSAGVDLDICIISINSPALEVACPPPGHRELSGNFCERKLCDIPDPLHSR